MRRIASNTFFKDPDDKLDYVLDLSEWLDDDTITGHTVTIAAGDVVKDSSSVNAVPLTVKENWGTRTIAAQKAVIVWISGGTLKTVAEVTVRVETAAGRQLDRSFIIRLVSR